MTLQTQVYELAGEVNRKGAPRSVGYGDTFNIGPNEQVEIIVYGFRPAGGQAGRRVVEAKAYLGGGSETRNRIASSSVHVPFPEIEPGEAGHEPNFEAIHSAIVDALTSAVRALASGNRPE